jgi:inner membrane protein
VLSHPAIPLAIFIASGRELVSRRLLVAAIAASVAPDLDAIGHQLGVPYPSLFGHRGFSHSVTFALLLGVLAFAASRVLRAPPARCFLLVFVSGLSHGLLDALTSGGLGAAFLSPFSNDRFFFPWRPIAVSPIGIHDFIGPWGVRVIWSELRWVWTPALLLGVAFRLAGRSLASSPRAV